MSCGCGKQLKEHLTNERIYDLARRYADTLRVIVVVYQTDEGLTFAEFGCPEIEGHQIKQYLYPLHGVTPV